MESFRYLTSDERVEHVMKQAEYFGHSGERVKGLIFAAESMKLMCCCGDFGFYRKLSE